MKGKLLRVCLVAHDAEETMKDFHDLFGVEFYGPFDDKGVNLKVALPRSGGMEVSSPTAENDPIGFSKYLEEKGEGFKVWIAKSRAIAVSDFSPPDSCSMF